MTRREHDLMQAESYIAALGPGPYVVLQSAFHGGGILSRHRTAMGAARGELKAQIDHGECACGGPSTVRAKDAIDYDPSEQAHYSAPRA